MTLPRLQVIEVEFDADALGTALHISRDETIEAFRDGRGAWPFTELWGQRLFEFAMHKSSNEPLSDGILALRRLGDMNVSVKALARGPIKFQQSKFVGSSRSGTTNDLIGSLEACDRVIAVDVTTFPLVTFIPLDTRRLISAAHRGALTENGWRKSQFYGWLTTTYEVRRLRSEI